MELDNLITSLDLNDDEYIVIGVSTGPDSMALLNLLMKNIDKKIVCAHINHSVRKESNEEAKYLENYCKDHNLIFEYYKIDSYEQNNFENEARTKRYAFYEETLKKYHSHTLFLAHHGDDLIETVLMKIIRGSNLEGYAGIKTYSNLSNYRIIRPLLSITKEDIIKYNTINNIKYFTDNTNEDTSYTRNRIRKNILPLLKKENPNVHKSFLKYSNTIQEYYNYIEDYTKKIIKEKYNSHTINIEEFKTEHLFIQKNIIYYILSEIYQNKDNIIKESHVTSIINLINNNKPNSFLNLPQNYQAKKIYKTLNIDKINTNSSTKEYLIQVENKPINIDKIEIKKIDNTLEDGNNICRLNSKNIAMPIYIRNKRSGDYIEVLGLNGKKKISDIFIEKKIPKDIRDTYPLLVDSNDNVLWIPNIKKSKYNVKKNELCDIILTSYEKGGNEIEEKRK